MTDHLSTKKLAALAAALASAADVPALTACIDSGFRALIPADEIIVDVTALALNRPAMIRLGVDDVWTKRYDREFHALNPATARITAALKTRAPLAARFADLTPEPLTATRFFRDYMAPQNHATSLVCGMSLAASGGPPAVIALFVRKVGRADFSDAEVDAARALTPALAWGAHAILRSSDEWTQAVVRHAFGLSPKLAEVAVLVARGLSNQEVADALGVTLGTTKQYVHELLAATGAASRADLARLVLS